MTLGEPAKAAAVSAHVSFVRAGYLSTAGSRDYQPWLYVRARLLSGGGKAQLYQQFVVYGAKFPQTKAYLPAQPQYAYADFDALMVNRVPATAGLQAGAKLVAATIAQRLR